MRRQAGPGEHISLTSPWVTHLILHWSHDGQTPYLPHQQVWGYLVFCLPRHDCILQGFCEDRSKTGEFVVINMMAKGEALPCPPSVPGLLHCAAGAEGGPPCYALRGAASNTLCSQFLWVILVSPQEHVLLRYEQSPQTPGGFFL